ILEHGLPRIATVGRLPYAARRRADVVHVAVSGYTHDGGHSAASHRGAEVAELEVVQGISAQGPRCIGRRFHTAATLRRGGGRDRQGESEAQERALGSGLTESHAAHRTNS